MYKATLNNKETLSINLPEGNKVTVEGITYEIENSTDHRRLIVVKNGTQTFKVNVHNVDHSTKTFQLRLNGIKHTVQIKDKFDQLLTELGFNSEGLSSINQIKAPMPGLILEVNVKPGDTVEKDDKVLVLEAMKMENVIKSPGAGEVKEVKIKEGDSVEKNQVLIQF